MTDKKIDLGRVDILPGSCPPVPAQSPPPDLSVIMVGVKKEGGAPDVVVYGGMSARGGKTHQMQFDMMTRLLEAAESLLHRYIHHIQCCEGIDYTDQLNSYHSDQRFSPREVEILQRLSKETPKP